jgi:NADH:ubiquinone oxidoreductase subunit H
MRWAGTASQSFADGIKLVQGRHHPGGADRHSVRIAPVLVIMGAFAAFAVVPWGTGSSISD